MFQQEERFEAGSNTLFVFHLDQGDMKDEHCLIYESRSGMPPHAFAIKWFTRSSAFPE